MFSHDNCATHYTLHTRLNHPSLPSLDNKNPFNHPYIPDYIHSLILKLFFTSTLSPIQLPTIRTSLHFFLSTSTVSIPLFPFTYHFFRHSYILIPILFRATIEESTQKKTRDSTFFLVRTFSPTHFILKRPSRCIHFHTTPVTSFSLRRYVSPAASLSDDKH